MGRGACGDDLVKFIDETFVDLCCVEFVAVDFDDFGEVLEFLDVHDGIPRQAPKQVRISCCACR